jgi:hypothetical protein
LSFCHLCLSVCQAAALRDLNQEPYEYRFDRTHTAAELQALYRDLEPGATAPGVPQVV